ncbi:hypothetical protein IT575_08280 [bacterium]|nr:hypothetical protein [bacterium]
MLSLLPWLFLAVLAFFAWLMVTRRMPASLALPLAAFSLALIALLPKALAEGFDPALSSLFTDVVESGVVRLSNAIFAVLLGAVLAAQLKNSGAAERVVRYSAEYAGEDRFRLGLLMLLVISLLFTSLGGLGAVILVASITLPLLFSLGYEPKVAATVFLFGLSLGGCLNPSNWAFYISASEKLSDPLLTADIVPFAVIMALLFFVLACVYLVVQLGGMKVLQAQYWPLLALGAAAGLIAVLALRFPVAWLVIKRSLSVLLLILLAALLALLLYRLLSLLARGLQPPAAAHGSSWLDQSDNWLAAAAALVPLLLLLWSSLHANIMGGADKALLQVPILSALLAGIVFAALASLSSRGGGLNLLMRSLQEGVAAASPAVVLLIGIGLLLQATALPAVSGSLSPWLAALPIQHPLGFVLVFFLLSPLALYRGPLNLYGMGSGVVGIMFGSTLVPDLVPPSLIMVAFFSVGMLQGVCDPTNTHNVWVANFCKVPLGELTRHTLPWVLGLVLAGLIAGRMLF